LVFCTLSAKEEGLVPERHQFDFKVSEPVPEPYQNGFRVSFTVDIPGSKTS
jgi:hypothetical protein